MGSHLYIAPPRRLERHSWRMGAGRPRTTFDAREKRNDRKRVGDDIGSLKTHFISASSAFSLQTQVKVLYFRQQPSNKARRRHPVIASALRRYPTSRQSFPTVPFCGCSDI